MTEQKEEKPVKDNAGAADKLISKVVSRKLLVWGTATAGLFLGMVPSDDWVAVALAYIGVQGLADLATSWKKAGNE